MAFGALRSSCVARSVDGRCRMDGCAEGGGMEEWREGEMEGK